MILVFTGWWLTYPSEKYEYEFVSWDDDIPNIWKNKTCSKPPTRRCCFLQYHLRCILKHVQDLTYLYNYIYIYNVHIIYIMLIALHSEYIIVTVENHHF